VTRLHDDTPTRASLRAYAQTIQVYAATVVRNLDLAEQAQARADRRYAWAEDQTRQSLRHMRSAQDITPREPSDAEVTQATNMRVANDGVFKLHGDTATWHRTLASTYATATVALRAALETTQEINTTGT